MEGDLSEKERTRRTRGGRAAYEIQDGRSDDRVESRSANEVEEPIQRTEAEGCDSGAKGKFVSLAYVGEEGRVGETFLIAC